MNSTNVKQKYFTKRIIKRIKHNIASVATTKSMSAELGISTRALQSKLEQEGATYKVILRLVRLIHACNLLRQTDLDTQEISKILGYKTRRQFNATFREAFGFSAQQYKDRINYNDTKDSICIKYKIKLVGGIWYQNGAEWIGRTILKNEADSFDFLAEAKIALEYIQLVNDCHEYSSAKIVEYHC